jgi:hypothetical protein
MKGVGPDEPTVQNEMGGKQSKLEYRFDLLPAQALAQIAEILYHGAIKYGEDNWHSIPSRDHLNRAITHAYAYLSGDAQDDHAGHAACRMLMFLEMYILERNNNAEE